MPERALLGTDWKVSLPTATRPDSRLLGWRGGGPEFCLPPAVTTTVLPSGTVTVPYVAAILTTGGRTIGCAVTAGSLPPGVALKGCGLAGTPTKAGSFSFTVAASNDGGAGSKALTVGEGARKFTKAQEPTISGKAKVGKTLRAKVKTLEAEAGEGVRAVVPRDGVAIPGATKAKYQVTKADKGRKLKVIVVGTTLGYQSSVSSKSTATVKEVTRLRP